MYIKLGGTMYSNLINNRFFKENQVKDLTAQQLVYAQIDMPVLVEIADEFVKSITNRAEKERLEIIKEEDPDKLIRLLRGSCDILNYDILHKKVLENEELLLPRIISMIKTTGNDVFIEHASKLIPKCKSNYSIHCQCLSLELMSYSKAIQLIFHLNSK